MSHGTKTMQKRLFSDPWRVRDFFHELSINCIDHGGGVNVGRRPLQESPSLPA
jgi:hypothetical protein